MSAIEDMLLKFTSGNDVAVQRAVVTLDEWRATYAEYMALQARVDELEHNADEHQRLKLELSKAMGHDAVNPSMCDLVAVAGMIVKERDDLRRLLNDAATSLETISRLAGKDEFMTDLSDIRTYAANRAKCARKANQIEGGA